MRPFRRGSIRQPTGGQFPLATEGDDQAILELLTLIAPCLVAFPRGLGDRDRRMSSAAICDFRVVILSALARWSVALPVADRRCFGMDEAEPVSRSLSGLVCTA